MHTPTYVASEDYLIAFTISFEAHLLAPVNLHTSIHPDDVYYVCVLYIAIYKRSSPSPLTSTLNTKVP